MAKSEYVRLSGSEKYYGQKNFLQSQLELLNLIDGFKKYKKLRQEELKLKISLKSKIAETLELMKKLDKLLPVTKYKPKVVRKRNSGEREKKISRSLQDEILEIKEKLRKLQRGD